MPTVTSQAEDIKSAIIRRVVSLSRGDTAELRAVRREFSRDLASEPASLIFAIAMRLIALKSISYRFIAYELVRHHRLAAAALNQAKLKQLGRGLNSWGAVDCFACNLAGPAWRGRQIPDLLIHSWARSSDHWWRRAALVSTVPLNNRARGGTGDTERTLAVCGLLSRDRDDMVVKAMSWALRQLVLHDRGAVLTFLKRRRGIIAPRVVREVNNKLRTGLKNP